MTVIYKILLKKIIKVVDIFFLIGYTHLIKENKNYLEGYNNEKNGGTMNYELWIWIRYRNGFRINNRNDKW